MAEPKENSLENLSDEVLMELYKNGEFSAFEALYYRHSSKVFEYLRKKVSNENAQDLLQDTFSKLHSFRDKYNSQYPFLPWLFTVTKNTLFDFFKKSESKMGKLTVDSDVLDNLPLNVGAESRFDVGLLLTNLPDNQKQAIELRYLSEWSFEKISEHMNTTPENIRQLISRGIKKIKLNQNNGGGI